MTLADFAGHNIKNINQSDNTVTVNLNILKVFQLLGKAEQRHRKLSIHILTTIHNICVVI